jgi:chemotaxis protein methyltransferase CheR
MQAASFEYIRQLVKREAAIVIEAGKEYLAENRLTSLAREAGYADIEPMVAELRTRQHGELHRKVIDALTTNETSFFRDMRPFDALRTTIIPEILAARGDKRLTIWCAASSSGQEPYSLAILIRDHFPSIAATTRIIASDISRPMLARTAAGSYSQFEVGRGLPATLLVKNFTQRGAEYVVKPELRAMLELKEINLAQPYPLLPPIDILLVRNVLIYFDPPTKADMIKRMRKTLSPHGVIMLGAAETTLGIDTELERCTADKASYYRSKRKDSSR